MNPLQQLLQALMSLGQGTPETAGAIQREQVANTQLNQQGSVMGSNRQEQLTGNQDPFLATLSQLINTFAPSPTDAGGSAAHVPGTFRKIGLERSGASGTLNPAQYLAKLQMEPNYPRFQQLVQMLTKQKLGSEFPVARGASQIDPLVQALQQGKQAPVTAVTHGAGGSTAERFAQNTAEATRKPSYVMQGTATPADVAAFVPRRGQYAEESELILNPTANFKGQLAAKYLPPSGGFPVERKAISTVAPTLPDEYIQAIQAALASAAKPPL